MVRQGAGGAAAGTARQAVVKECEMRRSARVLGVLLMATGLVLPAGGVALAGADGGDNGRTDVVIAPAVYDLIQSADIAVETTGPATAGAFMGTLRAKFPIDEIQQGGDKITHDGGLRLSIADVSIKLAKYTILLSDGVVTGKAKGSEIGNAGRVPLFTLAATSDPDLGAVDLLLTDVAAGALNATFGTELSEGDLFGHATPRPND
jgi:hypothetical protein